MSQAMIQFPEIYEFISFFEAEPVFLDPTVPWQYNRLSWTIHRGDNTINCAIEPADGQMDLVWAQAGRPIAAIGLRAIQSFELTMQSERE